MRFYEHAIEQYTKLYALIFISVATINLAYRQQHRTSMRKSLFWFNDIMKHEDKHKNGGQNSFQLSNFPYMQKHLVVYIYIYIFPMVNKNN